MKRLLPTLFITLFPWLALASGEASHGFPKDVIYGLVNFVILATLLTLILRVPLKDFFKGRSLELGESVAKADLQKQQAELRYQEYEAKLQNMDQELRQLIKEITEEGELGKNKILADAKIQVERISAENLRMIEQEVRRAKELLKAETIKLSVELASKLIQKNLGEVEQQKIVAGFINQVETLP